MSATALKNLITCLILRPLFYCPISDTDIFSATLGIISGKQRAKRKIKIFKKVSRSNLSLIFAGYHVGAIRDTIPIRKDR